MRLYAIPIRMCPAIMYVQTLSRFIIILFFFASEGSIVGFEVKNYSRFRTVRAAPDVRTGANANEPNAGKDFWTTIDAYTLSLLFSANVRIIYLYVFFLSPCTFARRKPLVYGTFVRPGK